MNTDLVNQVKIQLQPNRYLRRIMIDVETLGGGIMPEGFSEYGQTIAFFDANAQAIYAHLEILGVAMTPSANAVTYIRSVLLVKAQEAADEENARGEALAVQAHAQAVIHAAEVGDPEPEYVAPPTLEPEVVPSTDELMALITSAEGTEEELALKHTMALHILELASTYCLEENSFNEQERQ